MALPQALPQAPFRPLYLVAPLSSDGSTLSMSSCPMLDLKRSNESREGGSRCCCPGPLGLPDKGRLNNGKRRQVLPRGRKEERG